MFISLRHSIAKPLDQSLSIHTMTLLHSTYAPRNHIYTGRRMIRTRGRGSDANKRQKSVSIERSLLKNRRKSLSPWLRIRSLKVKQLNCDKLAYNLSLIVLFLAPINVEEQLFALNKSEKIHGVRYRKWDYSLEAIADESA